MIKSREDYIAYLDADRKALKVRPRGLLKDLIFPDLIYAFQRHLRGVEYYKNCGSGLGGKLMYAYHRFWYLRLSVRLGFSIPENVFGPGLSIAHYGTIVVNSNARVGKNCRLHACVNIGSSAGGKRAPQIGDDVYIGPGAILFGDIVVASRVVVGANSTVNKSFVREGVVIVGSPAREVGAISGSSPDSPL